jgi:TolA-binding protein
MRRLAALLVTLVMLAAPAAAVQGNNSAFWAGLGAKLQRVVPGKTTATGKGVAGKRDVQYDLSNVLYWKGAEASIVVSEAQLEAFNLAYEAVLEDRPKEAMKGFEGFLEKYPDSVLAEDARDALSWLRGSTSK